MLQTKYAKLRKKKKQLTASKNPSKPDQDKVAKSINSVPEAKDAKEVAKKLIRSGQIHAIQKSVEKERLEKSKGFKRSQGTYVRTLFVSPNHELNGIFSGLERKLGGMDARAGYQPFSATHGPGGGFDTGGEDMNPEPPVSNA